MLMLEVHVGGVPSRHTRSSHGGDGQGARMKTGLFSMSRTARACERRRRKMTICARKSHACSRSKPRAPDPTTREHCSKNEPVSVDDALENASRILREVANIVVEELMDDAP